MPCPGSHTEVLSYFVTGGNLVAAPCEWCHQNTADYAGPDGTRLRVEHHTSTILETLDHSA